MTINTSSNKISATADGIQTNFPYNFKVVDASHMKVYLDGILYGGAYTINGVGDAAGGSVDITTAPSDQVVVTLYREVPATQLSDYKPYRSFPSETVEDDLDLAVMRNQQISEESGRAVRAPVSDDGTFDFTLPAAQTPGRAIKVNPTGDGWAESDSDPDEAQADSAANVVSTNADVVSTNADVVSTNADVVSTNADVVLANKWAEEAEDVPVEASKYSALHWAAKAAASLTYNNVLINSNFTINQYSYVSGAVLAAGAFGHNRWKAGSAGGDYTFTQLATDTEITILAGKSLIQVIAPENVHESRYKISWEGTALVRVGINSATPSGSYVASPIALTTQTPGTVMSIEFSEGTLGKVLMTGGFIVLPYKRKSYEETVNECSRYMQDITISLRNNGVAGAISAHSLIWPQMRTIPNQSQITAGTAGNISTSSLSISTEYGGRFNATGAGTGDAYILNRKYRLEAEL